MRLEFIKQIFSICKISNPTEIDWSGEYIFACKTDEEFSLVCPESKVPACVTEREDGWCAFRMEGILDFSLTGILSPVASLLAQAKIGIFAVSTYNTDYILIKHENKDSVKTLLNRNGYTVIEAV